MAKLERATFCRIIIYIGAQLLPVWIGGKIIMALADTGCNQSVVSLGTFRKMKKQTYDSLELQLKNLMAVRMANGQKMEFIEAIKLKFHTC
jgi:hypothetical protein